MRNTKLVRKENRRKFLKTVALAGLAGVVAAPGIASAQEAKPKTTMEALLAAHALASSAQERCQAFAKQADADGYTQLGSLFRAAARSKEANVTEFARVIKKLGGTPKTETKTVEAKSTKENVEAFIKSETNDRDNLYPDFVAVAREERNKEAVKVLNYAKTNAGEYITLFGDALANLDQWKGGKKVVLVCTVCGFPALAMPDKKCPSCFEPLDKFIKVS